MNSCAGIRSRLNRGVAFGSTVNNSVESSEIIDSIISRYLAAASKDRTVAVKSSRALSATAKRFFNRLPHFTKSVFFLVMKPQTSLQGSRHGFRVFCLLLKRAKIPFDRDEMVIIDEIVSCSENNVLIRASSH